MSVKEVCIVEDESDVVKISSEYLEKVDYKVHAFDSYENYMENPPENFKGVYLIDWNLPGKSGIDLIKQLRSTDKLCPIFIISGYTQQEQILEGLQAGADDYLPKPFSFKELLARVENATQKYSLILSEQNDQQGLRLIPEANAFIKNGKTVNLTAREYTIFEFLVDKIGQSVEREELIQCFSKEETVTSRNIDVHIFSLRKKLAAADFEIKTVWGKGYMIPLN